MNTSIGSSQDLYKSRFIKRLFLFFHKKRNVLSLFEKRFRINSNQVIGGLKAVTSFVILAAMMMIIRGANLTASSAFNPDEAELLALGRRASTSLFNPAATVAVATIGPLQPLLLGLISEIGIQLTLPLAHFMAGLIYVWFGWLGWFYISKQTGWIKGSIYVLPTSLLIFGLEEDFLSLGTELIPLTLISIGIFFAFPPSRDVTHSRFLLGAIFLGSAPWAKPQVFLLSFTVFFVALVRSRSRCIDPAAIRDSKQYLKGLSYFLPSLIFVFSMVIFGSLNQFINETLQFNLQYFFNRTSLNPGIVSKTFSERIKDFSDFILRHPTSFLWSLLGVSLVHNNPFSTGEHTARKFNIEWLAIVISTLITLLLVSPIFGHYANLLYAGLLFAGMISTAEDTRTSIRSRPLTTPVNPIMLSFFTLALVISVLTIWPKALTNLESFPRIKQSPPVTSTLLTSLCPEKRLVSVWGWSAELYSNYNWKPASRYVVTNWQIYPTSKQDYYRSVYFAELIRGYPTCILDTANPHFFGGFDETAALLNVIPELKPFLEECYTFQSVNLPGEKLVQVWTKNNLCNQTR